MTITIRDTLRKLSVPWLQRGNNEKVLYAIGVHLDAFADATVIAVKQRFPGLYSSESLPIIGRERRIRRGRYETDAGYALRLRRWLVDHKRRGGAYAMLAQLHAFLAPTTFPVHLIYRSGARFIMDEAGDVVRDVVDQHGFRYRQWARWWLLLWTDAYPVPLSTEDADDLALIPREWIAAHCNGEVVVMPTGAELWDYPTGRVWSRAGVWDTAPIARIRI